MNQLNKKEIKTKTSYGIALCRINSNTHEPEVLMIRKRSTYEFSEFVLGRYRIDDITKLNSLLNAMTCYEKCLLKTMDFGKIWWYLTLQDVPNHQFIRAREKFDYLIGNKASIFLNLLDNAVDGELTWEMPKGRAKFSEEPSETAIRETEEETGIHYDNYILTTDKYTYSVVSYNIEYIMKYFLAVYIDPLTEFRFTFRDRYIKEVDAIKWWPLSLLKKYNTDYFNFVSGILENFKNSPSID